MAKPGEVQLPFVITVGEVQTRAKACFSTARRRQAPARLPFCRAHDSRRRPAPATQKPAPMKIAVVTPYYREELAVLEQCHRSVTEQRAPSYHIMVADGAPRAEVGQWPIDHLILPRPHGDIGSTPRVIGSFHAMGLDFDGVAFLDADNWYHPDHIASLLDLHSRTGAHFLSSSRLLCRLNGTVMAKCRSTDGVSFVDTSCMLLMRPAFKLIANWSLIPAYAQVISDRAFLALAKVSGITMAHSDRPTVCYRCGKVGIYHELGEVPPPGVQPKPDYEAAFRRWHAEGHPALFRSCNSEHSG